MCALSATKRRPNPGWVPNTLPTSSMRTSSSPTSRKRSDNQAARADSPNGGAAILAISICHCSNCGSCARNQLKADRTSGEAASRATSRWISSCAAECLTAEPGSGKSARGGFGLMEVMRKFTTRRKRRGLAKAGTGGYRREAVMRRGTGDAPVWLHARPRTRSLLHGRHELLGRGSRDVMPGGTAHDRSGYGVEFGRPTLFHVFLHRTAHQGRHLAHASDDCLRINFGLLRRGNGASLAHTCLS